MTYDITPNVSHLVHVAQQCLLLDPGLYAQGETWYANAWQWCQRMAQRYPYTPHQIAGVVAALSPQVSWERNLTLATSALDRHMVGLELLGQTQDNLGKAQAILDGVEPLDALGGLKVRAFYQCIISAGETDQVCVDRHAVAAYYAPGDVVWASLTPKRYAIVAAAYTEAAAVLGVTPAQCQAIVWCAWRRSAN